MSAGVVPRPECSIRLQHYAEQSRVMSCWETDTLSTIELCGHRFPRQLSTLLHCQGDDLWKSPSSTIGEMTRTSFQFRVYHILYKFFTSSISGFQEAKSEYLGQLIVTPEMIA